MNLYKLISEHIIQEFPNYWVENDVTYTNAAAQEKAIDSGMWHPLVLTDPPVIEQGQYLLKHYSIVGENIVLTWEVITPRESAELE